MYKEMREVTDKREIVKLLLCHSSVAVRTEKIFVKNNHLFKLTHLSQKRSKPDFPQLTFRRRETWY
ncbi:hypothetical protein C7B79_13590 [Chroococcidiopsis cubana CCALA 043]|nr:hypothetical protein C7B79_13590 [Chroococcidiopsis cubana CCALA 043]